MHVRAGLAKARRDISHRASCFRGAHLTQNTLRRAELGTSLQARYGRAHQSFATVDGGNGEEDNGQLLQQVFRANVFKGHLPLVNIALPALSACEHLAPPNGTPSLRAGDCLPRGGKACQ